MPRPILTALAGSCLLFAACAPESERPQATSSPKAAPPVAAPTTSTATIASPHAPAPKPPPPAAPVPTSTAGVADPHAPAAGPNLALGRPYRFNVLPTTQWQPFDKQAAGTPTVLTDGKCESSLFFWCSQACVSFMAGNSGVDPVEVTIDLGSVQPIAGVATHHTARVIDGDGIDYPRREEYLVSADGVAFTRVAACVPPAKPAAEGFLTYACSGLHTAGRFVRVRTWGSDRGTFPAYVGYDEITVTGGTGPAVAPQPDPASPVANGLPATVMGYRIAPQDWPALTREQPLYLAPGPYAFLGDGEFHLTAGGAHALEFIPLSTTAAKLGAVVLTCDLPADVEVLSWNRLHRVEPAQEVTRDGHPYRRYRIEPDAGFPANGMSYPFLILALPATMAASDLGVCAWSWTYTLDGVAHAPGTGQLRLIADPAIHVQPPRAFQTGFWQPYTFRHFVELDRTLDRLFTCWRDSGFNVGWGGDFGLPEHAAGQRAGISVIGETCILSNALMVRYGMPEIPVEDRFQYHPAAQESFIGVCPTVLATEPRYAAHLQAMAAKQLAISQHMYENWEPYMFLGKGCICPRCKEAFGRSAGLPAAELDRLWPDVVRNRGNASYTRFASRQYAQIVRLLQRCARQAGESLQAGRQADAILALEPGLYFSPTSPSRSWHDPSDYLDALDQICVWSYPNQIQLTTVTPRQLVGNTLTTLAPVLAQVLADTRATGRRDASGRTLPRVTFMQGGYQLDGQYIVLPSDAAFTTLFAFFIGMDGCATFEQQQKPDARYLAANARAHALVAALEPVVMHGRDLPGVSVTPASPVPQRLHDRAVQTLWSRAISGEGRTLVAIGNDHVLPVHVRVTATLPSGPAYRLADLASGRVFQRDAEHGFAASDLAAGVLVGIPAKSWAVLEVLDHATTGTVLPAAAVEAERRAGEAAAKAFVEACTD